MGYATKKNVAEALVAQVHQGFHGNGTIELIGDILIRNQIITETQRDAILKEMTKNKSMEPDIIWDKDSIFNHNLSIHKTEKQLLGEYIGGIAAGSLGDTTIFLAGSTTLYYVFRGLVKSSAKVKVRTVNAAIISVYPSVESQIGEVSVIWDGNVDLNNAIITPYFSEADKMLPMALQGITHAMVSCIGFDSERGPIIENSTARVITEHLLKSNGNYECWFVIDHSKITNNWPEDAGLFLFHIKKDWDEIRGKGNVKIIVDVHPQMPSELARDEPSLRGELQIKNLLKNKNVPQKDIKEVIEYQRWSMKTRDIVEKEVLHPHQR